MKKLLCTILAVLMLASVFAGCQPVEQKTGSNKYNLTTVTPGVLTVATSPDYAPFEFYAIGEDGKPYLAGFDIALAEYIADYLDLGLKIVPMDFDGVLMEVGLGTVDMGVAGLSPDPERAESMLFSDSYYEASQVMIVKGDDTTFDACTDAASVVRKQRRCRHQR